MRRRRPAPTSWRCLLGLLAFAAGGAGCAPDLDVGSDVLWSAGFETGTFDEWIRVPTRGAEAFPAPGDKIEVSNERAHDGGHAAKLTIDTSTAGEQQNTLVSRTGSLPTEAYYSAWYYLPRSENVGTYWVIFKFRLRTIADDPSTSAEFYDLDLRDLPSGEMTMVLYDHRLAHEVPLGVPDPVVPVGIWFQLEAFYRNTQDTTGHLTVWLDGRQIIDIADQPMAPTPWIEWDVGNIGEDLTPSPAVLFIDDCAVSQTRVGPTGVLTR